MAVGSGAALGFEALTRAQELASLWGADWPDRVGAAASALHAAASSQVCGMQGIAMLMVLLTASVACQTTAR